VVLLEPEVRTPARASPPLVVLLALPLLVVAIAGPAWAGSTELVSVSSSGAPGDASSSSPSISADGRYVAFESFANNFVPNDTRPRFTGRAVQFCDLGRP
jgi:hypothetical protein